MKILASTPNIRLIGNKAAHEIFDMERNELDLAMDIIENLLNTHYIVPIKHKRLSFYANLP